MEISIVLFKYSGKLFSETFFVRLYLGVLIQWYKTAVAITCSLMVMNDEGTVSTMRLVSVEHVTLSIYTVI